MPLTLFKSLVRKLHCSVMGKLLVAQVPLEIPYDPLQIHKISVIKHWV